MKQIKFIDLFCGLGGIRIGFEKSIRKLCLSSECVLSSDIKKHAKETYSINFKEETKGNISLINTDDIPDFDILLGGFPCQAFSNAGKRLGFEDTRGTLFFEVARILKDKQPKGFILENVEGLVTHDNGNTFKIILTTLEQLNYHVEYKILDSYDFGLAQHRKRIYIVGSLNKLNDIFIFDTLFNKTTFGDIREHNIQPNNSKFNQILHNNFKDLLFLSGKSIKDKRGGHDNIHSWDIAIKGKVTKKQSELLNLIVTKRRYKQWAIENNTAWFDGIPLSLKQIKSFIDYENIEQDLTRLVNLGYLKMDFPKDYQVINGIKTKISRQDLPEGYTMTTGKLSFEFTHILNDNKPTGTIVATDASKLGVIEKNGIRKLTTLELKRLFGFPDNYQTNHLKDTEAFDLFGNSVAINVIEAISYNLLKKI